MLSLRSLLYLYFAIFSSFFSFYFFLFFFSSFLLSYLHLSFCLLLSFFLSFFSSLCFLHSFLPSITSLNSYHLDFYLMFFRSTDEQLQEMTSPANYNRYKEISRPNVNKIVKLGMAFRGTYVQFSHTYSYLHFFNPSRTSWIDP